MERKISIVIPVYNGEKHIESCIEDILKQNYNNYEIIVINDGSIDNTKKILNKFLDIENLRIINKKNTGVSDTRNIGIKIATGEYIIFLDSDDKLEHNALKKINEKMENKKIENKKIDMLIFGFEVIGSDNRFNDTEVLREIENTENIKEKVIERILSTRKNIFGYVWRAIYSKEMLNNNDIRFPENIKISEDYMFLLNAVKNSNEICVDHNEYYKYILNESSMSIKYIPTLLSDMMFVNNWVYDNVVSMNTEFKKYYYCNLCNTYLRFIQNTARNSEYSIKEMMKIIKEYKNKYNFREALKINKFKYNLFTKKTYISLIMFNLHLEFLYVVLFLKKEKRRRK